MVLSAVETQSHLSSKMIMKRFMVVGSIGIVASFPITHPLLYKTTKLCGRDNNAMESMNSMVLYQTGSPGSKFETLLGLSCLMRTMLTYQIVRRV